MDVSSVFIKPGSSTREAMECMQRSGKQIALVVDDQHHLIDTITDGDIRLGILTRMSLDTPIESLQARRQHASYTLSHPVTAPVGTSHAELLHLMQANTVRHVPLLDEEERVVDMALMDDLLPDYVLPVTAVVMAGGYGKRLLPLTEDVPKPMLPVGDRPLLEWVMENLRCAGVRRVVLTTHYKGDVIADHLGDGRNLGMEIRYVHEDQPLGTAGVLSQFSTSNDPLLVVNGDVLTRVDYRSMLEFHQEHQADITVAVQGYELRLPFGVVDTNGVQITGISEKPVMRHFVNAGMYLVNPDLCSYIPDNQAYDMPDLINRLLAEGRRVVSFPIREYWLDIGHLADYQQARQDESSGRI